jgi:hypothetical protein
MHIEGIIIGLIAFTVIGIFHPVIIYGEYHFGTKLWPLFLGMGIVLCGLSFFAENIILSAALGVVAFCCFWSIKELFQQQKRVERGWFPRKPKNVRPKVRPCEDR